MKKPAATPSCCAARPRSRPKSAACAKSKSQAAAEQARLAAEQAAAAAAPGRAGGCGTAEAEAAAGRAEAAPPRRRPAAAPSAEDEAALAREDDAKRRKALAEAEAIRAMMNAPRKVLVAKKPDEGKAAATTVPQSQGAAAAKTAAPGVNKEVKSAKLSSSWAGDPPRKGIPRAATAAVAWGATTGAAAPGRRGERGRDERAVQAPAEHRVLEVHVPETITVAELAHKMAIKASEVIKVLMKMGQMVTINQPLDQDTAMIVVEEMGHKAVVAALDDPEAFTDQEVQAQDAEALRAPVVTVMGHVDHGKTSLLDYIRRAKVAAGEAGGITQHIGAYHVETPRGMSPSWTPRPRGLHGHACARRQATDIVILVVAADDGVMPQTKEAIKHAKAAGCPSWWPSPRSTSPTPTPSASRRAGGRRGGARRVRWRLALRCRVRQDRPGHRRAAGAGAAAGRSAGTEGAGGCRRQGPGDRSQLDKGRGPVATVLVQSGTLNVGDVVLAGQTFGRVRAMLDENGKPPSRPARRSRSRSRA
jgi:translation initiation factor IF-2